MSVTAADTCRECNVPLVRLPVDTDGAALSAEQRTLYERAQAHSKCRLTCASCGVECWHDNRRRQEPPEDGRGTCKRCGGMDGTLKRRAPAGYPFFLRLPVEWSCPTHGTMATIEKRRQTANNNNNNKQ